MWLLTYGPWLTRDLGSVGLSLDVFTDDPDELSDAPWVQVCSLQVGWSLVRSVEIDECSIIIWLLFVCGEALI